MGYVGRILFDADARVLPFIYLRHIIYDQRTVGRQNRKPEHVFKHLLLASYAFFIYAINKYTRHYAGNVSYSKQNPMLPRRIIQWANFLLKIPFHDVGISINTVDTSRCSLFNNFIFRYYLNRGPSIIYQINKSNNTEFYDWKRR